MKEFVLEITATVVLVGIEADNLEDARIQVHSMIEEGDISLEWMDVTIIEGEM